MDPDGTDVPVEGNSNYDHGTIRQDPGNWMGGQGGNHKSLDLEPDEKIIKVTGRAGDHIDALNFYTDKGRHIGGGGSGGNEWTAEIPPGSGVHLAAVSAAYGDCLNAIFLHWRYKRWEGWINV